MSKARYPPSFKRHLEQADTTDGYPTRQERPIGFRIPERELTASEFVIHELYDITSRYDDGLEAQMDALLRLGLERFGLDIGIVSLIVGDTYEVVAAVAPDGVALAPGDTFPLGDTYCSVTIESTGPVGFERAGESDFATHPAYGIFKLEAYIGLPLRVGGELYGTLNFSSAAVRERTFEPADLDALRLMGSWLSTEIGRREMEEQLLEAQRNLEHLVRTDPLTDLANRRGLEIALQGFSRRHTLDGTALSCVLVDIDDFKGVNDVHGHAVGDRVIRAVADSFRSCLRPGDVAGRVGGDEFMAVLPGATPKQAGAVAHRVVEAVRRLAIERAGEEIPVTVSIGVAGVESHLTSVTDLLLHTQELLRHSKAAGKDSVTMEEVSA